MKKSKIKIFKVYEGTRSAKDVLTDAIAEKVRKKLDSDRELIKRKEYNQDSTDGDTVKSVRIMRVTKV